MPESEKCVCCQCLKKLPVNNFYKTQSKFYKTGRLPICKDCFYDDVILYREQENFKSTKMAMQRMCMAFDLYFDEDLFDTCDVTDDLKATILKYVRIMNMRQNSNKTFDDTILESPTLLSGERKVVKPKTRVVPIDEYGNEVDIGKVKKKDTSIWGFGFEPSDYEALNAHYQYLKEANPNCDSNQEIFIKDLCYIQMQKMKALQAGDVDAYNKLMESYRKSFNQAGLSTKDDNEKTEDCWSSFLSVVSQYTPEEFYLNKQRYSDFDGLGDYFERFIVRPLDNIVEGTQVRDAEFYVHEDDAED